MSHEIEKIAEEYHSKGFAIMKVYENDKYRKIQEFALNWIIGVIQPLSKKHVVFDDIPKYHEWFENEGIEHSKIFINDNRVIEPGQEITELIQNHTLLELVKEILKQDFHIWRDPGVGWLCYRMIRPNFNDGYHLCKKSWGDANKVASVWLPIVGNTRNETLQLLPGSHLKDYKKKKDPNNKFVEPELDESIDESSLLRPDLKDGEVIIYHPDILHSENVVDSDTTRFNLEFRFNPE